MKNAKNILLPSEQPLRTAVLVLSDCNTLSFAAAVDPMRAANRLAGRGLFDWQFVTATGAPAQLTSRVEVPGLALARLERCDLLIVVAGFRLDRHDTPSLRASLRRIAAQGTTIAGIDGGPWLMAAAGILDEYRATTHWEDLDNMSISFPGVTVLRDRYHIDGPRMTSGGAMPAIDMMLHLIEARHGAPLAARVAGAFIHDAGTNPARAQRRGGPRPAHNRITARASALMEQSLDAPLTIAEIARSIGTGKRSLELQFRKVLNTTPQGHYLDLRLSEALRLVTDTDLALLDIAMATGFNSQSSFARAFRAKHGLSARQLRSSRS